MNQKEVKQRLIELLNETFEEQYYKRGLFTAPHTAEALIANGVTIRERGEWEVCSDEYEICASEFVCSSCKESFVSSELSDEEFLQMMKFCPHCGADMRGVKDESCSM